MLERAREEGVQDFVKMKSMIALVLLSPKPFHLFYSGAQQKQPCAIILLQHTLASTPKIASLISAVSRLFCSCLLRLLGYTWDFFSEQFSGWWLCIERFPTMDKNNLTLHTCKVAKIATKIAKIAKWRNFFKHLRWNLQIIHLAILSIFGGYFGYFLVHFTCMVIRNFRVMICMWESQWWSFSWQPPRWKKRLIWDCPKVFPGFIKAFHNECEGSSFNCPVTKERRDYAEKAINAFST